MRNIITKLIKRSFKLILNPKIEKFVQGASKPRSLKVSSCFMITDI